MPLVTTASPGKTLFFTRRLGSMRLPPALCTANVLDSVHWQKGSLPLPFPPTCLVPHFWFSAMGFLYLKKEPLASKGSHPREQPSHPGLSWPAVQTFPKLGQVL